MRGLQAPVLVGAALVVLGILWLLRNLGVITTLPVAPVLLIVVGAIVLLTALREEPPRTAPQTDGTWDSSTWAAQDRGPTQTGGWADPSVERTVLPIEGAARGRIVLNHGAGTLRIRTGAPDGALYELRSQGTVGQRVNRQGDHVEVNLQPGDVSGWVTRMGPVSWELLLSPHVLLDIEVRTGAAKADVDLAGLTVERFTVKTGASDLVLALPDRGRCRAVVSAGAADVRIRVPAGVAASVVNRSALATVSIDEQRFPRTNGIHRSVGFDDADVRADIELEGGVASFQVR